MFQQQREDGWTTVSYRRGRQQKRRQQPPLANRSYASVTRGAPRQRSQYPTRSGDYRTRADNRRWRRSPSLRRHSPEHRRRSPDFSRRPPVSRPQQPQQRRPWGNSAGRYQQQVRGQRNRYSPPRQPRYFNQRQRQTNTLRQNQTRRQGQTQAPYTQNTSGPNWVQSNDPDFTHKVRIIYRIIKSNHHLKNVSGDEAPPIIRKTTADLADFIKPASPSPQTQSLLEGNAKNWEHSAILILRQHYEDNMNNDIQDLADFPDRAWEGPFQVATAWAKRNLGRRLRAKTILDSEAFLKANLTEHHPAETREAQQTSAQPAVPAVTVQTPADATATTSPAPSAVAAETEPPTAAAPRVTTVQAQIHAGAEVPSPGPSIRASSAPTTAMGGSDVSPLIQVEEEQIPSSLPPPLHPSPSRLLRPPPPPPPRFSPSQVQVGDKAVTMATPEATPPVLPQPHNPCVRQQSQLIRAEQEPSPSSRPGASYTRFTPYGYRRPSKGQSLFTPNRTGQSKAADTRRGSDTQSPAAAPKVLSPQTPTEVSDLLQLLDEETAPETPTRRPTRHVSTTKKLQDWGLCVRNQYLVIGDSNLSRLPPIQGQNLQVDSYPGATFLHAESILRKAVCIAQVDTVILSFGLNSRKHKTRSTTVKQLQKAVKMAQNRFPEATIRIPIINFSSKLPLRERMNLQVLNNHITRHCDFLTPLPETDFSTEGDNIHWTRHTASKIFEHWMSQLNL